MAECVGATDFIGGGAGALDAYDGADYSVGDAAMVFKNGQCIPYILISTTNAENSPWLIRPDTNGTGIAWQAVDDVGLNIIGSNTTLYANSSTGSDTTGDGTSGNPWASLGKAIDWLGNKVIASDVVVTISLSAHSFTISSTISIVGSQFAQVEIAGAGSTSTTLTGATAGVGIFTIDNCAALKDLRNIKLLGDGTNGTGISLIRNSALNLSADVKVDSFNTGVLVSNSSTFSSGSAAFNSSNNNSYGVQANINASVSLPSCTLDSNGQGARITNYSFANLGSATVTNNTTGIYAFQASHGKADSVTFSGNTTDTSPTKTTAADPVFANRGSWIYG